MSITVWHHPLVVHFDISLTHYVVVHVTHDAPTAEFPNPPFIQCSTMRHQGKGGVPMDTDMLPGLGLCHTKWRAAVQCRFQGAPPHPCEFHPLFRLVALCGSFASTAC